MKASWLFIITAAIGHGEARSLGIRSSSPPTVLYTECSYEIESLKPRFLTSLGSQRLKIRYGPFAVPPAAENNGIKTFYVQTPPPCEDCFLTQIQANLEYPDGTIANTKTGLSLHNLIVTNLERDSITCPLLSETIYTTGNERTAADLCLNG
ncbi:hypothetical protein N0V88_005296 [Collariella sp. IMI 366227]|nr:hypothetical protein N0V88_005296 [Collariella sp. IMI 366227]